MWLNFQTVIELLDPLILAMEKSLPEITVELSFSSPDSPAPASWRNVGSAYLRHGSVVGKC